MLNIAQLKCLSVFSIFALIGFGPISPGCLIGMYIVWKRPDWFRSLVSEVYNHRKHDEFVTSTQTQRARIRSFLNLSILFVIDIAPIPVTPMLAFFIILTRPKWFYTAVGRVYGEIV